MSFPTAPILDRFNRIENPVSCGAQWTHPVTTGGSSNIQCDGATAFCVSGGGGIYWNAGQFADGEVYVTPPADNSHESWMYFRIVSGVGTSINGYALHWFGSGNDTIEVLTYTSGSAPGGPLFHTGEAAAQIRAQLGARFVGSTITVFSAGVALGTVTDSTYTTAGYLGFDTTVLSPNGFSGFGGGITAGGGSVAWFSG